MTARTPEQISVVFTCYVSGGGLFKSFAPIWMFTFSRWRYPNDPFRCLADARCNHCAESTCQCSEQKLAPTEAAFLHCRKGEQISEETKNWPKLCERLEFHRISDTAALFGTSQRNQPTALSLHPKKGLFLRNICETQNHLDTCAHSDTWMQHTHTHTHIHTRLEREPAEI